MGTTLKPGWSAVRTLSMNLRSSVTEPPNGSGLKSRRVPVSRNDADTAGDGGRCFDDDESVFSLQHPTSRQEQCSKSRRMAGGISDGHVD